jgi:amino acid adenylation domain-containing protein
METPRITSVAESVASQASLKPEATALASASAVLTYRDLEERANALAAHLRDLGVGPDVVVGLCAPRSPGMIVGALGILKAGGAYLPMDPTNPAARLAFMLHDAKTSLVVAEQSAKDRLPQGEYQIIDLDGAGSTQLSTGPRETVTPENLAYVIYTSGSTGRPKGVEISHRSLLNLVEWHQRTFHVSPADRASQVAKVGFDAAVWEIWPYLTAGASLHIPEDETVNDSESLLDWLLTQRITKSFIPTPMAERLLTMRWPSNASLRIMLTGADILHVSPPPGLPFELVNNYGPTECTVVTTSGPVPPNGQADRLPPIGRPIANTQVYILNESGKQAAEGEEGELYIGGAGLARGYRNRPELTAERFVPNPFKAGEQLFRTGDRVKILPDRQIAFLGRMDEQVKVRGYRVEPNEVAAALNAHPDVMQSVVVGREFAPGDNRLIGYLVSAADFTPTPTDLRQFLAARLPDYMVPSAFVTLDALPLTPNGKVDRDALPIPDETNTLRDNTHTLPRTETEKTVAAILTRLLGLERVDVHENFFSLGGHSLLGAQLVARVRAAFGVEMPLRVLFEAPTVAGLSAEIDHLSVTQ